VQAFALLAFCCFLATFARLFWYHPRSVFTFWSEYSMEARQVALGLSTKTARGVLRACGFGHVSGTLYRRRPTRSSQRAGLIYASIF